MATGIDKRDPIASQSDAEWQLITALLGGTKAMRAEGETYLPKRPLEETSDYQARLNMSTLYPALSETVKTMTGRVFARPLILEENIPDWIADEVLPDIDLQGRNLHAFCRDWFTQALGYGLSHCLVEAPKADSVRTRADQKRAGVRPYVVQIAPERILGWRTCGAGSLQQVRIKFERCEPDGEFGTKTIQQIRVYEIGRVRTYEKSNDDWALIDDVLTDLDRIPLVTLYTGRTAPMLATPPLRELAYLNAKHWRMQSGNDTLVDTASVPILAVSGVDQGDDITIGAKHAVRLPMGATIRYVEHTGAAIGVGRESILELQESMRQAGAKLINPRDAVKTATQVSDEAARDNSALGAMVEDMEGTIRDLLKLIAEYRGQDDGGSVQAQPNLDPDLQPVESMAVLREMRNDGVLSDATLFAEAKRRGLVADDVEWEIEQERISAQVMI